MKIRYLIAPAERMRKELGVTPGEFSRKLDYDERAYEFALERGHLTPRMMREVSVRFKVPMSDFKRIGDGQ